MCGAVVSVGLSSGGLPVIDPSSGVPSLEKDQPRGEFFYFSFPFYIYLYMSFIRIEVINRLAAATNQPHLACQQGSA